MTPAEEAAAEAFNAWLEWVEAEGWDNPQYDDFCQSMTRLGQKLGAVEGDKIDFFDDMLEPDEE